MNFEPGGIKMPHADLARLWRSMRKEEWPQTGMDRATVCKSVCKGASQNLSLELRLVAQIRTCFKSFRLPNWNAEDLAGRNDCALASFCSASRFLILRFFP